MNDRSEEDYVPRSLGRRDSDLINWRLTVMERMLSHIQDQLDTQDERYDERFITRKEIVAKAGSNDWTLRIILALIAAIGVINAVLIGTLK